MTSHDENSNVFKLQVIMSSNLLFLNFNHTVALFIKTKSVNTLIYIVRNSKPIEAWNLFVVEFFFLKTFAIENELMLLIYHLKK